MVPPSYNDMLQIFQTPDHVVVMQEMSNNPPRIIPLDQPHLPSRIRQWPGDSRGRWEGDTLVVDTVNFNEKTHYEGSTEALRVVERFTRVDAETIRYEFTVQDDRTWARPWSVEFPLMMREGPLYEYACHEGNHDIRHILEVARNVERQTEEARAVMMMSWPRALPDMAALVAVPLPRSNQRLIITPMGPTDEPPLPMAKMMPYNNMTCHWVWAMPMRAMPAAAMTTATETTLRTLKLSTSLPTKGMETAETIMKQVAARESAERLRSRSSLMGLRRRPKAKREPLLKNSTVKPVARMTQA